MDAVSIEQFTVGEGRLVCEIRLAPSAPRVTSPGLIRKLEGAFPHLARHACVNDKGVTFGAVMNHTSLPHLLEHLVIDLQVRGAQRDDDAFAGTTDWIDQEVGTARIQVSFTDDLAALRAFRDAVRFLNDAVVIP